jgi:hypothetical protein
VDQPFNVNAFFYFEGRPLACAVGEPLAAALLRAGIVTFRRNRGAEPRGLFCGIGICHDCLVRVNGRPNVRACVAEALPGLQVQRG